MYKPMRRPYKASFRKDRTLQVCLAVSLALHVALLVWWPTARDQARRPVLTVRLDKFVKAAPPRRTLSRRPRPLQRPLVRRPALQAAPVAAVRPAPATLRALPLVNRAALRLPVAARPEQPVLPVPDFPARHIGPQMQVGAVEGTRRGADEIDLSMELMDVQALDTGRHRAMVVVDPKDRRQLKGFLYLSGIYSPSIERAEGEFSRRLYQTRRQLERRMLQGLADKMVADTHVHVEVRDAVRLDDPRLLQVPFVVLTASGPFEFTDSEAANLGAYLTAGGFLFAEIVRLLRPNYSDADLDIPAVRSLVRASFQAVGYQEWKDWQFRRLERNHPLYHCFYDVNSLPRGMRDMHYAVASLTPDYLEGIMVGEQLVGVYSMRGYADFWAGLGQQERETLDVANSPFTASAEEELVL